MTPDRRADEAKLDETLDETFPASDAPANTVETGIRAGIVGSGVEVVDNASKHRFEIAVDGHTAFLAYERSRRALTLRHTEVPTELRGRHLGEALVEGALTAARSEGLQIVVVCPFARAYLRRHPPSPPLR